MDSTDRRHHPAVKPGFCLLEVQEITMDEAEIFVNYVENKPFSCPVCGETCERGKSCPGCGEDVRALLLNRWAGGFYGNTVCPKCRRKIEDPVRSLDTRLDYCRGCGEGVAG